MNPTNRQGLPDRRGPRAIRACITVKGREALERADVVVYDRLAHPSLLDYAPAVRRAGVFAGKARGQQELTQDGINALLVERARAGLVRSAAQGRRPLRLRARRRGSAGIGPLRHPLRGGAGRLIGHCRSGLCRHPGHAPGHRHRVHRGQRQRGPIQAVSPDGGSSVRWEELARSLAAHGGTLMTLMGWASIEKILEALQRAGLSADTPVALVQWGTWSRQRTVTGTLETAAGKGRAAGLAAPVVA